MNRLIPGTTINFSEQAREAAFSQIAPVLDATGGLTLSQLSKLSGLEGSTIQNWIKRGWVSSANGKKYSEKQVVRVLLINMLRGAMKLEDIARLMNYVNGDVEDTSDDIIPDITLYNILCRIIFSAEDSGSFESEAVHQFINAEIEASAKSIRSDEEKLRKAMFVMIMAYRSGFLKQEMETVLSDILNN